MASRTKQKEEARARRLAEERQRTERARRQRRLRMVGGMISAAIVVVVVLVVLSSSGGGSSGIKRTKGGNVQTESQILGGVLTGIPQSGMTLGSPSAKVTVTEFGDLECPVCKDFALGAENQLISNDVKSGKVKLVYRSLETATGNAPDPNIFGPQQAAAYAAGLQGKGWDYVELFYHQQGQEATGYVNGTFLADLARQIPGLNVPKWQSDSQSTSLLNQVKADEAFAASKSFDSTPTLTIAGPKGQTQPLVGNQDYGTIEAAIKGVE